jgi:hypothetical protein
MLWSFSLPLCQRQASGKGTRKIASRISLKTISSVTFAYSADCEININSLEYFDFTGDGIDEAVVVASTCASVAEKAGCHLR